MRAEVLKWLGLEFSPAHLSEYVFFVNYLYFGKGIGGEQKCSTCLFWRLQKSISVCGTTKCFHQWRICQVALLLKYSLINYIYERVQCTVWHLERDELFFFSFRFGVRYPVCSLISSLLFWQIWWANKCLQLMAHKLREMAWITWFGCLKLSSLNSWFRW